MLRDGELHDDDLLGYALGESDPASVASIEAHLACCLYCRVRLNHHPPERHGSGRAGVLRNDDTEDAVAVQAVELPVQMR